MIMNACDHYAYGSLEYTTYINKTYYGPLKTHPRFISVPE